MSTVNNFEAQIKKIEDEIQRATLEFQAEERHVEELRVAIETAKNHAKQDEREVVQKSSELVKAERDMHTLKTKVEGYHRQLDEWHTTMERARHDMEQTRSKK